MNQKNPREVLRDFLAAWYRQDWKDMFIYCQDTWCSKSNHSPEVLRDMFGLRELMTFTIGNEVPIKDSIFKLGVAKDFICEIEWRNPKDKIYKHQIRARLLCEIAPYQPRPDGDWGVNPISIL